MTPSFTISGNSSIFLLTSSIASCALPAPILSISIPLSYFLIVPSKKTIAKEIVAVKGYIQPALEP
jgi:hypothetical protein